MGGGGGRWGFGGTGWGCCVEGCGSVEGWGRVFVRRGVVDQKQTMQDMSRSVNKFVPSLPPM